MSRTPSLNRSNARVVVIGGGQAGVSVSARLLRAGLRDVRLVRDRAQVPHASSISCQRDVNHPQIVDMNVLV